MRASGPCPWGTQKECDSAPPHGSVPGESHRLSEVGPQADSWEAPSEAGSSGLSTEPQPSSLPTNESESPFSTGVWGCPSVSAQDGSGFRCCGTGYQPCWPCSLWGQMSISISQGGRVSAACLRPRRQSPSLWSHLKNARLVRLVSRIPSWTSCCDLQRLGWASTRITCSFPGIPTPGSFP